MREGQVSKQWFCSWCGAPAMAARASASGKPWRGYWATSCVHAAPVERMGPARRADVVARYQATLRGERVTR